MMKAKYVRLADKWRYTTGSTIRNKPTAWAPLWDAQAVFCYYPAMQKYLQNLSMGSLLTRLKFCKYFYRAERPT